MLNVLLLGLKIIGIILLALLLFLLLTACCILFVPVRYRAKGSYHQDLKGKVKFTWLLHMISLQVEYEKETSAVVRIFGFKVFPKKKKQKKRAKKTSNAYQEELDQEKEELTDKTADLIETITTPAEEFVDQAKEIDSRPVAEKKKKQKQSRWHKLQKKLLGLIEKAKKIKIQIDDIKTFLQDPKNTKVFRLIYKEVRKVLRHILPQRGKGNVVFGFEDPYTTGQVLSAVSLFYGWYPSKISIYPVFDEKILEADLEFKGRMRVSTLTFWLLRIYGNKQVKGWIRDWKNRGGS